MARDKTENVTSEYATVRVDELRISRRGKHHSLISGILEQLEKLADGSALVIPLGSVGELSLASLRSAVARATHSRHLAVKTYSDENNFYIWKKREAHPKPKHSER